MRRKRQVFDLSAVPAKVSAPRLVETYRRKRLFRALDARKGRTVWIHAPAGAGKTSLVTSYLAARRVRFLWYNVDARDADVANLFHYVTLALRLAYPRRKIRLPAFTAQNQPGVLAFARQFFEAVYAQLDGPMMIVFDDYHEACAREWDEVIREALSALTGRITVIMISRSEPPPTLARQIATEDVTIIDPNDLRLTTDEMVGLIRLHRPDLRGARLKAVVPRICELANGWAAALALLLRDRNLGQTDGRAIDEAPDRLFEYFASEVLDKISADECEFLLRTAVVPSLTPALASRLTGAPDAGRILAGMERRSFLIQRLGRSGAYRYHPLWRSFLLRRAETDMGRARLHELNRQAAESLMEVGQIDEAMDQLETAQDVSMRAQLILRAAPSYVAKGRTHTIETWIRRLPADTVEDSGWLTYWQAVCSLGHSPSNARRLLERAFPIFARREDTAGLYASCAAAIQAVVHEGMDFERLDPWVERFEQLGESGAECPPPIQPMAASGMLMASMFRRRNPASSRIWAEKAMKLTVASDDIDHRVMTEGLLALYFVLHDEPSRAATIVSMLRESARMADSSALPALTLLVADAMCTWVQGDNEKCVVLVREALALADRSGVFVWNDHLAATGAAAALASDEMEVAEEFLRPLAQSAQRGFAFSEACYAYQLSWKVYLQGDIDRALSLAEAARRRGEALGYPFGHAIARFGLAQAEWSAERPRDAEETLRAARKCAEEIGCDLVVHSCDLVEADFFWEQDRARALACLRRGFGLARRRGYYNMFWLGSATMARAALHALEFDIEPEYVRALIRRRRLRLQPGFSRPEQWVWPYRLRALGSFEVIRDPEGAADCTPRRSHAVPAPRGMPLRLLQAIVAMGGRGIAEHVLIDMLWPDAEGDAARRVFDTTLHRLRRQLGEREVVRLRDGTIFLDENLCWVDLWALDDAIAEARRALQPGASTLALEEVARRLLAIYRGELLADEPGATWVKAPRKRIAARFHAIVERLGQALEKGGAFAEAAALYHRVLADEVVESARAGLMRCTAASAVG
jgi:LuxR family maltose regulon positive regulatory protein